MSTENNLAGRGPIEAEAEVQPPTRPPVPTGSEFNSAPSLPTSTISGGAADPARPLAGPEPSVVASAPAEVRPSTVQLTKELSPEEEAQFARDNATIKVCLKQLTATGAILWAALARIRDRRTYRKQYKTFDEYCELELHYSARRARQLCQASETVQALGLGDEPGSVFAMPASEKHVRPLYDLPMEHRGAAWAEAWQTAPDGKMTYRHVAETVRAMKARLGLSQPAGEGAAPKPRARPIDVRVVTPAGRKEERLRDATERAISAVRYILDLAGTADSQEAADLQVTLDKLQTYRDKLESLETLQRRYNFNRVAAQEARMA